MTTGLQPSASALNVARCRAVAAHEPRAGLRGPDHLAEVFLDEAGRQSLRDPHIHALIRQKMAEVSPGGYEFFVARTAYLDDVFERAARDGVPQIVLLGTGYDTRGWRFGHLLAATRVFELDSPATLDHKRALLEAAQVATPDQLVFVPIDFTAESLLDRLTAAGYAPDQAALFIWEGVTYYLLPTAVDETLHVIRHHAGPGSVVCFDYMLPANQLAGRYGAQQSRAAMQAMYTAEPLHFDLDETQIAPFLAARGFALVEHLTADDMQARYLMLADGTLAGQVLDLFRLVQARVLAD